MHQIRIFFGGDICGSLGVACAVEVLPELIKKESIDFVIVNGENAAEGTGIELEQADLLFKAGVDVITGGNHSLERFNLRDTFAHHTRMLRPANYPFAPGSGLVTVRTDAACFTVLNLQGRQNMVPIDCPFQTADALLSSVPDSIIMVDFHAESVEEKEALAYYLDGRVSCVFGSHTHVQTADERILPKGTGYISDAGMIGGVDSIIGGEIEVTIQRNLTLVPHRFQVQKTGKTLFCGIIADISNESKQTQGLKRVYIS